MIDKILCEEIQKASKENNVAVLLSGGVDSISVALAAHRVGKKVTGYTFHLKDQLSYDAHKAQKVCEIMNWSCQVVEVPIDNVSNDFIRLRQQYDCLKKTHYECTFPFLYVYPKIEELEVLSGIAADGHYGVSKKACLNYKEPKEKFDLFREDYFKNPNPAGFIQQKILCERYNKIFVAPYLEQSVKDFFRQYDWYQLNKPHQKHHVRNAFKEFERFGKIKPHINLQLGSNIDKLFESVIIPDKTINFRDRKRIMDICRDWRSR